MKRGTCISVAKTADCQIRVVSVTAGQHPGRGYPRSNGWRSTTKWSKVQFGGCVWLGGGEDRPAWDQSMSDVDTPPVPTRNWPATFTDANWSVVKTRGVGVGRERTFRFGTCAPVFLPSHRFVVERHFPFILDFFRSRHSGECVQFQGAPWKCRSGHPVAR